MFKDSVIWQFNNDKNKLEFKTAHDVLQSYNTLYSSIFENINLSPDTPQGQLISFDAQKDMQIINNIEDIVNYFFNGGSGIMLDMWAWNTFRATRKEAVEGYAIIQITGTPNTIIPAGFIISDGNLQYELNKDITIGNNGQITSIFYNKSSLTDLSKANTITQIVTPQLNVERVNNENDSIIGIQRESDTAFYTRCVSYGSLFANGSYYSIMANIAQLQGVVKVSGYENYENNSVVFKGTTFNPHSIGIVVQGGNKQEIGNVLSKIKPVGTDMMGNVEVSIENFGRMSIYKYYEPTPISLKFDITIKSSITSPKNYKEQIIMALDEYITGLEIGAYITQPEIAKAIENYVTGFFVVDIKLAKKTDTIGYNPIELNFTEIATFSKEDVTIGTI